MRKKHMRKMVWKMQFEPEAPQLGTIALIKKNKSCHMNVLNDLMEQAEK